ncbi:hypothetical protein [Nocardia wallacei]|uniref:hypothetical protein n=1 Tax=Nocardia wallacei TaxID=480035 RepID=UPI002454420B|nr:hypothetical protein [Nocardia wallacei]
MVGDHPDDGLTDLAVILPIFDMLLGFPAAIERKGGHEFGAAAVAVTGIVGQPQVAAEDVDALLPTRAIGFVGGTRHRVHPGDPDRDIGSAELARCRSEAFYESALLDVALATVGNHQRDNPTDPGDDRQCDTRDIDRRRLGFTGG